MKTLKPSGYVPYDDSTQPGYLAARMRRYKKEAEAKAVREQANAIEAVAKVKPLIRGKVATSG